MEQTIASIESKLNDVDQKVNEQNEILEFDVLNDLFQLADYERIKVEWANLTNVKGLYLSTPSLKSPVIALAHDLHNNERELRCVLAHELRHHFTTSGHYIIAANELNSVYATESGYQMGR